MEMRILNVTARRDAVDKLIWKAELRATDWGTSRLFLLASWSGDVVLYHQSIDRGSGMGPQAERIRLSARWLRSGERNAVRTWATSSASLVFETELPGDALERIEAFRGDNRIFARLEGTLFLVTVRDDEFQSYGGDLEQLMIGLSGGGHLDIEGIARDLWQTMALWNTLADPQRILGVDFSTESFELSRERWDTEIRAVLRPEIIAAPPEQSPLSRTECASATGTIASDPATGDIGSAIEEEALPPLLVDARTAFRAGKFIECIKLCSDVANTMHGKMSGTGKNFTDYGPFHHEIKHHARTLGTMYRPDAWIPEESAPITEHLARHVFTCTESLYQVYRKMSQTD
jgi:hypothetical protein